MSTAAEDAALAQKLESLAKTLSAAAGTLKSGGTLSLDQREELVEAGEDLVDKACRPQDKFLQYLARFTECTALAIFIRWKVLQAIPAGDGASASYQDLADKVGAETELLVRLARPLLASGVLKYAGADRVAHTPCSLLFSTKNSSSAEIETAYHLNIRDFGALQAYFDKFGRKQPTDPKRSVTAFLAGMLGSTIWEIFERDPERVVDVETYGLAMGACEEHTPPLGSYDLGWVVEEASKSPDRPLLVDVGGGKGHALEGILQLTPGLPARRCVLVDMPAVVAMAKRTNPALADVSMAGTDFHREQPVKGALVYYIRHCVHDYNDDAAIGILKHIADAMVSDSRLLIVDAVVENPPSRFAATFDMMMLMYTGKERTIEGWQHVTSSAGLKIQQVVNARHNSVIECAKV